MDELLSEMNQLLPEMDELLSEMNQILLEMHELLSETDKLLFGKGKLFLIRVHSLKCVKTINK